MDHTYFANSTNLPRTNNKSNKICSVPQCGNRTCEDRKISLHCFPKDIDVLLDWMYLFKLRKRPKFAYACSDHFCSDDFIVLENERHLRPDSVPSRKLPMYSADALKKKQSQKENRQKWNLRKQLFYKKILSRPEEKSVIIPKIVVPNEKPAFPRKQLEPPITKKKDVSVQVETIMPTFLAANRPKIMDLIQSDAHMQTCTSLTIKQFHAICDMVNCFLNRIPVIRCEELSLSYSILLTLMKLKENHSFSHLSFLFDMNVAACSSSFYKMIGILRQVLYQFITWPSKEEIRRDLPKHFSNWPQTRVVIDCVEIEIFSSRCLKCYASFCSHLKMKPTIKFLVGMAPTGPVIFLTDVYDGETSAGTILKECGLLNLCEPGDIIIGNSGFVVDKPCQATDKPVSQLPVLEQSQCYNKQIEEIKSTLLKTRPVPISTKFLPKNTRLVLGNIKLVSGNTRPVATNTKPVAASTRPIATNTRPVAANTRLVATNTRPAAANTRPLAANTRLVATNTRPVAANTRPVAANTRLVATNTRPIAANTRPVAANTRLVATNTRPAAANTRPVATNTRPATTDTKLLRVNIKPACGNAKPLPENTRPVGANTIPVSVNAVRPTATSLSPPKMDIKTVERIKSYQIINSPITSEMFDGIDLIINVICALVNFTTSAKD